MGIGLSLFNFSPSRAAVTKNTSTWLAHTIVALMFLKPTAIWGLWSHTTFKVNLCCVQLGRDDEVDFLASFPANCFVIPLPVPGVEIFLADTLEIVGDLGDLFDICRMTSVMARSRVESSLLSPGR